MLSILKITNQKELKKIMQDIGVDPCGIKIMLPKGIGYLVRIKSLSNIAANVLKQEMLSIGGDVAVARNALTGKTKKTDCLIIGNNAQVSLLYEKLKRQPFGLNKLARDLSCALENYRKDEFTLALGRHRLNLGRRAQIMGIVNLTPDSFSGDGLYSSPPGKIVDFVEKMVEDGADIIDVGGESTRPGAKPVSVKEELARVVPAIKAISKKIKVPISIDTCKPEVARQALDNGAVMVNDITGLKNPLMAKLIAKYKAGVVIMHMQGKPRTMQVNPKYRSLISDIIDYLGDAADKAVNCGIEQEKIIIDPGIGFGKTVAHNLEILKRLSEFKILGRPILIGVSRKSFIGKVLNAGPEKRIFGTLSACILAANAGANILRVHDVKGLKEALIIKEAVDNI